MRSIAAALAVTALAWAAPCGADPEAGRGRSHGLTVAPRSAQQPVAPTNAQQPAGSPRIEVLVIDASTADGGVAQSLSWIPQLRQPPFNAFTQMRLISRATVPLTATPSTASLPGNRSATIALASLSPGHRYTVNVTFSTGGNVQFVAGAGEPFFTVRASRPNRATILGFVVRN